MRAWQVVKHGEPKEVMELGQKAVPEPGPGEVRIVVKYSRNSGDRPNE
jgi:NADPH:quinone reductase-like Zn-dependent oxidoreductase